MSLSIQTKLFLTFFAGTFVLVLCMFVFMQASFDRGFAQLINPVRLEIHSELAKSLEEAYESEESWDFMRNSEQSWAPFHTVVDSVVHKNGIFALPMRALRAWKLRGRGNERLFDDMLVVMDRELQVVTGTPNPIADLKLRKVHHRGVVVGYLGMVDEPRLTQAQIQLFLRGQTRAFALIALIVAASSILLSFALAVHLVSPVRTLSAATQKLISGKFDTRVPKRGSDELGQLSRGFNTLANTLEQNEAARRRWIADISHELRTPLSILRGELDAVRDEVRPLTPRTLESIENEVVYLNRLVDDLYELSMSDVGALGYEKATLDVVEALSRVVEIFRPEFEDKGIALSFEPPSTRKVHLFADSGRLQQLFSNVLVNSLRYTDAGGELKISLEPGEKRLMIHFQDSAPGVPNEHLGKLFDRLYRVEPSRSRSTGGTGLGLAICKNIAEAHDGSLRAQQSPLGGLWITIEIPT